MENQITEKEDKISLAKVEDELNRCIRENRICYTDFLDMRLQGLAKDMIKGSGVRYFYDGGYEDSERRILVFLPDWAEEDNYYEDRPIEILRVKHKMGGKLLSHRDYLGSLLGLGISRSVLGDIIVYEDGADIIIDAGMEEFLLANYFKAGRTELSMEIRDVKDINLSEIKFETITDTLASLRLDAFLASAFKGSRSKAVDAVKQGLVFVNNAQVLKPDFELKEKDRVSLKGKGKCILEEVGGHSRKDRIFVTIKRYI